MTRSALSIYMYGLYLVLSVCLPFVLFPHFTLGLFGLGAGDDVWVRFVGVLAGVIGLFYVAMVMTRSTRMFPWTVPTRYASAAFMCVIVALGKIGLALLIFAALDALTASITWVAIRADAEEDALA